MTEKTNKIKHSGRVDQRSSFEQEKKRLENWVWRRIPQKIRPFVVVILCFLVLFWVDSLANAPVRCAVLKWFKENHFSHSFKDERLGLLVARFKGKTMIGGNELEGQDISSNIVSLTRNRFEKLKISNGDIFEISTSFSTHEEARKVGKKYHADIVIWGEATIPGILYKVTVVNPDKNVFLKSELTFEKESQGSTVLASISQMDFPVFTNDPVFLGYLFTGLLYYSSNEIDQALSSFEEVLRNQADFKETVKVGYIHFLKGNLYGNGRFYEKAITEYNEAIDNSPDDARSYGNRGLAYYKQGKLTEALRDLSEAIKLDENNPLFYSNRGAIYSMQDDYADAQSDFKKAIELDHKCSQAYFNQGHVLYKQSKYPEALQAFTEGIRWGPNSLLAYNDRGCLFSAQGKSPEALKDFTKEIKLNRKLAQTYRNIGNGFYKNKKYASALWHFNEAYELDNQCAPAYYNRGNVFYKQRKYREAMQNYDKAIDLNPNHDQAYKNRGVVFSVQGKEEDALSNYNKAIKLNSQDPQAFNNRGILYATQREYEAALQDFDKAIELDHQYHDAYVNRGTLYLSLGKYPEALSDYNKALELNSKDALTYYSRGYLYGKQRKYAEALKDFDKVIELSPKDAEAYFRRAVCYFYGDDIRKAWQDVYEARKLGFEVPPRFLKGLKNAEENIIKEQRQFHK